MKLASAPTGLRDRFDVLHNASIAELSIEPFDIRNDKTIGRAVAGARPLLGVVPLKVKFNVISPDGRVARILRGIRERSDETQLLIEADRRVHVARHQNWLDGINAGSHGSLSLVWRTLQISHARRTGEPSLLNDWAMLSVGVIIDEGEIKGVGLWLTGSALLLRCPGFTLDHRFHRVARIPSKFTSFFVFFERAELNKALRDVGEKVRHSIR
jgi:hypothetical protein